MEIITIILCGLCAILELINVFCTEKYRANYANLCNIVMTAWLWIITCKVLGI